MSRLLAEALIGCGAVAPIIAAARLCIDRGIRRRALEPAPWPPAPTPIARPSRPKRITAKLLQPTRASASNYGRNYAVTITRHRTPRCTCAYCSRDASRPAKH